MKKPLLIIGIILFTLFLSQNTTKRWWAQYGHRYIPNTCMSLKIRVEKKAPSDWQLECPGTENLILTINVESNPKEDAKLKHSLYKLLANSYVNFARFSNLETLEQLQHLTIVIEHPKLKIISKSDGKNVSRFAGLKKQQDIAIHLRGSVKVLEVLK